MKRTSRPQVLGPEELSVFCYELGLMVQAGIGSEESVGTLAEDAGVPREKELLQRVHGVLLEGGSLSAALEERGAFPSYLLRMVEIGEAAGRLDQALSALSAYYRREADTRQSLRRAIAYPAAMAVLIAVVFLALVARVLPVFQQVFDQLGGESLPSGPGTDGLRKCEPLCRRCFWRSAGPGRALGSVDAPHGAGTGAAEPTSGLHRALPGGGPEPLCLGHGADALQRPSPG